MRKVTGDTWAYEIWKKPLHPPFAPNARGTLRWTPKDPDHPEYLYLAMRVLGDHYADLSAKGIWQE